jgi:hypothetical protein
MPLPQELKENIAKQGLNLLETGSRYKAFDQVRQRHFWSDLCFIPNVNGYINSGTYKAFITPSGQVGQGFPVALTELETNWKSANRVPDNQNFEVLEVGVTPMAPPDMTITGANPTTSRLRPSPRQQTGILTSSVLSIQYLTNEVPIGLCNDFQQASGPQMGSYEPSIYLNPAINPDDPLPIAPTTFSSTPATRYITNGFAAPGLRRRFKVPILLQHGETFSFNINVPRSFYYGAPGVTLNDVDFTNAYVLRIDFWATESFVEKS